MKRLVEPEILDGLSPDDPRAVAARGDLRRLNWVLGHAGIFARGLRSIFTGTVPRSVLDLGAGDGTFLLRLLRRLPEWTGGTAYLLDRRVSVSAPVVREFEAMGWRCESVRMEVLDFFRGSSGERYDLITANLFLHHFPDEVLEELLMRIATRAEVFAACEPERSTWGVAAARLVGCIGCGPVTRVDAVRSVRAGFTGEEISRLWPERETWKVTEARAGLFSHRLAAVRRGL